jgi:polyisoprenoid-binding protein YceI
MRARSFSLLLAVCLPAAASSVSLDLDPAQTDIQFTLHDVLHTVHGTFKLKRGSVRFDPETGQASGEIVVDAASGASGSEARDRRMHKEILESQRYPEAVFNPDRMDGKLAPQGSSQIDVYGVFKIHGADHRLTLHFDVRREADRYTAAAHFVIPYVEWGMKNPSNFLLKVEKTVDMDIKTILYEH